MGVFDIFAKDAGTGGEGSGNRRGGKAERWLSPAPGKRANSRTGINAEGQEQSAFDRFMQSMFGCCMGRLK